MPYETKIRVRFGETDLLGHVNNCSYFIYLEQARVDFFTSLTGDVRRWRFILASIKCDFVQQAYFNQTLRIETGLSKIGTKSLQLVQPIFNDDSNELIARGESTMVYFNFDEQKSEPLPERLRRQFEPYQIKESD